MIFSSVDVYTMQLMIAATHVVFLFVLLQFSQKNKDIEGLNYWLYASILLTIDTCATIFPAFRSIQFISTLLIITGYLSYIFFMIGCFRFSKTKLHRSIPYALFSIYIIYLILNYFYDFNTLSRIDFIGAFISATLILSIKSILNLDHKFFLVEKYLMIFLLALHIGVYASWTIMDLGLEYREHSYYSISIVSIYVIDAMIFMVVFLLILAKRRQQLSEENNKYRYAQKEIAMAISNANIASKAKTLFLSNLSFDLRTPLNSILGLSEVLNNQSTGTLNSKQQGFLDYIHNTANNLLVVISSLIDLSNIETSKIELDIKFLDANEYIGELIPTLQKTADRHKRQLKIRKINELDAKTRIKIDPNALQKTLLNLLANAIEYSSVDKAIVFEHGVIEQNKYSFAIIDNGVGIDNKFASDVFKPFIKPIDGKYYIGSTGTGLAIAKGLADLMHGDIKFESQIGKGAKFWVEFPLH